LIEVGFKDNKASGKMNMGDQSQPIEVDLGGAVFSDGAGSQDVIAALPLAEGYTATFRNLDLQTQKPKLMQLKVAGVESVTVPAGTFDAWKVDVASAEGDPDKSTVWVARDSRMVVKTTALMPAMGGATFTMELAP
jgi:hypothetical protein